MTAALRCPDCGRENRLGASFCDGCGTGLVPACASCGHELRAEAQFCDSCGTAVAPSSGPDHRSITPAHLAERILSERNQLEGERRTVTVLFADAKGFTPISEQIGEEEVYALVQGCTQRMVDAVHRYDGFVNQFAGDGIMAIFGAPIAHEDSARRAVAAALDMQSALGGYAEDVKRRHPGIMCAFRVGLNTGPVVVGKIGDDLGMDYTAVGDTTNLAARMEQMAEAGSVYLTDQTYRQASDFFEFEALGPHDVKGKSAPVAIYKAVRPKDVRTRFEAATLRGLSPFVGRERELAVLDDFMERAAAGQGQVVLVAGEAGIGKSRLMLELRRRFADRDVGWIEGQCISYGEGIPYLPLIDLTKRGFGIVEEDDDAAIIAKVDEATSGWEPATQKTVPYLKFLLQVDSGDPAIESMDPMERRAGILDAVRALVVEQSRERPLALVVEDLHWADDQSEAALQAMLDVVPSSRVLFVGTFRPGYEHALVDLPQASRLSLAHLAGDESAALASSVLHAASLPSELTGLITTKAEGNPLFIEEVTKALVESGVLTDGAGGLELTGPAGDVVVPDTIQEVILSRIDRLADEAKHAIQLASVIGREFTVRLLRRISDIHTELDGALGQLKALELIYEASFFPELAYMFKHALTHDVAYSTLLGDRRRSLHLTVAQAIEELYADRLTEHYETLAYHYEEAESWERALDYLTRSADKAATAFANQEAIAFYVRALAVARRLGSQTHVADLLFAEARVRMLVGDLPAAVDAFLESAETARAAGDSRGFGLRLSFAAVGVFFLHDFERAEAILDRCFEEADPDDDEARFLAKLWRGAANAIVWSRFEEYRAAKAELDELIETVSPFIQALFSWSDVLYTHWEGRFDDAIDRAARWLPVVHDAGGVEEELWLWWSEGLARSHRGEYEGGLKLLLDTVERTERIGHVLLHARALNSVGWVYGELQDLDRAFEWNQRGLAYAEAANFPDPEIESNAALNLGDLLMARGKLDEAKVHFERVYRIYRDPEPADRLMLWRYAQHMLHSYGEWWLRHGDQDQALSLADECLDLAQRSRSMKNVVKARRLRGQVFFARGETDAAAAELESALEVAHELGNPGQLWKTHAALGMIHGASSYRDALDVIDRVASGLADETLREMFLDSSEVSGIREAAGA